jgi:hypothetical protein
MEKSNPHLKLAVMEIVENQLETNEPPETRLTLERLTEQGISEEETKLLIAQAVTVEIYNILKNKEEFDKERFVKNLKRLPKEPKE